MTSTTTKMSFHVEPAQGVVAMFSPPFSKPWRPHRCGIGRKKSVVVDASNRMASCTSYVNLLGKREFYVAGPPVMLHEVAHTLEAAGDVNTRVYEDLIGV